MPKDRSIPITAIILAAGSSSRMGQSKQMLQVSGEPLLRYVARVTQESNVTHTLVVLGQHERVHNRIIRDLRVSTCIHPQWEKGMGSSLKVGLEFVLKYYPEMQAIIALVGDQPLLTANHLNKLIDKYKTSKSPIVASAYNGILGVPALFDASHFLALKALDDAHGARQIIEKHKSSAVAVDFPEGSVDLDTPEDYQSYQERIATSGLLKTSTPDVRT